VVAIVTGRAASDARRLIATPDVLVVGNHGLEWLDPGADAPRPENGVRDVPEEVLERVPAGAGVIVERKGPSASIHYRLTPDREAARERILGSLRGALPAGLAVSEGRMSVEIRPRGLGDKGSAAEAIVERHGLDAVVVMGDDVTDLDMFRAVARLRSAGRVRGVIVAVGSADGEVPDAVAAEADVMLAGPDEVVALLRAIS
jgi:trehalose 6-phosphate phosphatase